MSIQHVAALLAWFAVVAFVAWAALRRRPRRTARATFSVGIKRVVPMHCDACLRPIHDGAIMVAGLGSCHHGECVVLVRSGGVIVGARRANNGEITAADEFRASIEHARGLESAAPSQEPPTGSV